MPRIIRGGGYGFQPNNNAPSSIVKITEDGEIIREVVVEEEIDLDDEFVEDAFDEEGNRIERNPDGEFEETVFPSKSAQEEAEEEAARILDDAARKAKGLITQAKMEARNIKIAAREEGYQQGFDSAVEKIDSAVRDFDAIIQEIQAEQNDFVQDFESTIVSFAIEIANEIMRREIEVDPFALCDMVEHSMHTVREAKWAVVTLSKKLTPLIELLRSELALKHKNIENIDVVGLDIDITECTVDTPNGRIELSLITQLDNLVKRFEMIDKE